MHSAFLALCFFLAQTAVFSQPNSPISVNKFQKCNFFSGPVKAEWLPDGRQMKILERFTYTDPSCVQWIAPVGSIVDGASIPQVAWSFMGGPFEGKYRDASVIHDVACVQKSRPWQDVHLAFYNAMLASGVEDFRAKVMYGAVYHFGPHWPPPSSAAHIPSVLDFSRPESKSEFDQLESQISIRQNSARGAMSLEEIRTFNFKTGR
jgi:hypothetical protein